MSNTATLEASAIPVEALTITAQQEQEAMSLADAFKFGKKYATFLDVLTIASSRAASTGQYLASDEERAVFAYAESKHLPAMAKTIIDTLEAVAKLVPRAPLALAGNKRLQIPMAKHHGAALVKKTVDADLRQAQQLGVRASKILRDIEVAKLASVTVSRLAYDVLSKKDHAGADKVGKRAQALAVKVAALEGPALALMLKTCQEAVDRLAQASAQAVPAILADPAITAP